MMIGASGMSCSWGSCGVAPVEANRAPESSAGTPRKRMLMAVPLTT